MQFQYLSCDAVPNTLYHYTSLDALVAIVQTKRLRASNIRFLNDSSECLRLREDVIAILQKRLHSSQNLEIKIIENLIHTLEFAPEPSYFVASLSEKGDLLSQWRAYCPPGLGVSIGFSSEALQDQWIANPTGGKPYFLGAPFQKVRYYESEDQPQLEQWIGKLLNLEQETGTDEPSKYPNLGVLAAVNPLAEGVEIEQEKMEKVIQFTLDKIVEAEGGQYKLYPAGTAIAGWVSVLSPFVKHSAFTEECEWRKVVSKDSRPMPGQKFRSGKSTLIPFVDIMLDVMTSGSNCIQREKYFINEVIVGPTPTPKLTIESLHSLFYSEGHPEVAIRSSHIPFRSW